MHIVATSWSLKNVWRWFMMIALVWTCNQCSVMVLKLLKDSYERIVFPAPAIQQSLRSKGRTSKSKEISRIPGHQRVFDRPSRQFINSLDSSIHWPVPSSRFWKISLWISLKLRGDSQSMISRRSGSEERVRWQKSEWKDLFAPASILLVILMCWSWPTALKMPLFASTLVAAWKKAAPVVVLWLSVTDSSDALDWWRPASSERGKLNISCT